MSAVPAVPESGGMMNLRPSIGLLLSIGEPPEGSRVHPRKIDHFRAKTGQRDQFVEAAEKFREIYGPEPKIIDDVFFLSNEISDVLDVRRKVWGQSGIKAMSKTNLVEGPASEFRARIEAWDEELRTWVDDQKETGTYRLTGPDDQAIAARKMKTYATLRVALPRVTGIGTVVEITTTSKRSTDNLFASLVFAHGIVRGNLIGIPFRLSVRPARMRYWDEKESKRKTTDFYELVLDTPLTMAEMFSEIQARKEATSIERGHVLELPPVSVEPPEEFEAFFSDSEEREVDAVLANAEPPSSPGPDDGEEGEVFTGEVMDEGFEFGPPADAGATDAAAGAVDQEAVEAPAAEFVVQVEPAEAWVNGLTLAAIAADEKGAEFLAWASKTRGPRYEAVRNAVKTYVAEVQA